MVYITYDGFENTFNSFCFLEEYKIIVKPFNATMFPGM